MASEKMRYNHRYMEDNPRIDIELTPLKTEIEAISSESNIDEDCDTIEDYFHLIGRWFVNC